jgi:hypothetical protein
MSFLSAENTSSGSRRLRGIQDENNFFALRFFEGVGKGENASRVEIMRKLKIGNNRLFR